MRVVVSNGTYESAYGIVRSLVATGAEAHVAHSERAQDVAVSRFVKSAHPVPKPRNAYDNLSPGGSRDGEDPFALAMLDLARKVGADVVVPTDDDEVVALTRHQDLFAEHGILCTVPSMATARTMMDKFSAVTKAAEAGIPVPRTAEVTSLRQVREFASDQGFPVVLKRRISSGSKGVRVIRSADELDRAYEAFADRPCMVQEYVPGDREPSINAIRDAAGGFRLVLCLRKQRYLNTSVSTSIRIVPELPETPAALRFLDLVGAVGFAALQVRENPATGEHLFIESNIRWGANSRMLLPLLQRQGYRPIENFVDAWRGGSAEETYRPEGGSAVSPVEDLLALESLARYRASTAGQSRPSLSWGSVAGSYWDSYVRARPLVTDYLFKSAVTDPKAAVSTLRRAFRERRRADLSFLPLGEIVQRRSAQPR